jgi:hypothetical protein
MECELIYKDLEDFLFSKQAPRSMPCKPNAVKSYMRAPFQTHQVNQSGY